MPAILNHIYNITYAINHPSLPILSTDITHFINRYYPLYQQIFCIIQPIIVLVSLTSRLIYQHVHVVGVPLQKLTLLAVLNPQLYLAHLRLKSLAHLLHLENHLRVGCPSSLLHYFDQCSIDEDTSLGRDWRRLGSYLLGVLGDDAAPHFLSFVLEVEIEFYLISFGLDFDRLALFDQHAIFKQTHHRILEEILVLDFELTEQIPVLRRRKASLLEEQQQEQLVV